MKLMELGRQANQVQPGHGLKQQYLCGNVPFTSLKNGFNGNYSFFSPGFTGGDVPRVLVCTGRKTAMA